MSSKRFKRVAAGVFVVALIIVGAALLRNANKPPSEKSVETAKTPSAEGDDMRTPSNGAAAHEHETEMESHETGCPDNNAPIAEIEVPNLHKRPLNTTGDIEDFHEAYLDVNEAIILVKEGRMEPSDLYALIDGHIRNNSDWRLYLHVHAKKELGLPLSRPENNFFIRTTRILDGLLRGRWSSEMDEWDHRLKPIKEIIRWAKVNAPLEYKQLGEAYLRRAHSGFFSAGKRIVPIGKLGRYADLDGRTAFLYDGFFEALGEMPSDARIFTEYFNGLAMAQAKIKPRPAVEGNAPPPSNETHSPPETSPDVQEDSLNDDMSSSSASPNEPRSPAPPPPDDPAHFEAAVTQSIERYGVQEGMLRLAESHPEWRLHLFEWLRARQRGNESE